MLSQCILYYHNADGSSCLVLPKLTAKSYMPRKTAPPNEIASVLGCHPRNNALNPSFRAIASSRGGKERTEGDCCVPVEFAVVFDEPSSQMRPSHTYSCFQHDAGLDHVKWRRRYRSDPSCDHSTHGCFAWRWPLASQESP